MTLVGTPTVEYHRNGISGEGFYAVAFTWCSDGETRDMIAVVFPPERIVDGPMEGEPDWGIYERGEWDNPRVAVFDAAKLPDVRFFHNSWRGDKFAPDLYKAIREHAR
jgi:hypothetical protein